MARLEHIRYVPHRAEMEGDQVKWNKVKNGRMIDALPQIIGRSVLRWLFGTPELSILAIISRSYRIAANKFVGHSQLRIGRASR